MDSDVHLCDVISDPLCTSLLDTKLIDTQGDIRGARYQNSAHAISHCRTNVQMVIIQTLNTYLPPFKTSDGIWTPVNELCACV